jgi:catechol 2,3-dioxygenase-like lactoylglutathione lyase family enzyme
VWQEETLMTITTQSHYRSGPRQGGRRSLLRSDFGLPFEGAGGHFAPVRVNDTLTLDFADAEGAISSQHYAFHVSDVEFDAILQRVKAAGLAFGSGPWSLDDGKLNDWNGGRGFYFEDPDGHVIELMTVPQ